MFNVRQKLLTRILFPLLCSFLASCATAPSPPAPPVAPTVPPPAPPPPPPPPPPPAPTSEKVTYATDALFDPRSSDLKPHARARLDEFLSKITEVRFEVIIAVGFTDASGSEAYNLQLSNRRAQAVKDYLVSKGVEPNRVYAEGLGGKNPVADNRTREGRAKNNRVEVEVVGTRPVRSASARRPNNEIPVLFATNRQRTGSDNPYHFYGNRLIDDPDSKNLQRGIALVRVPPTRERGEVKQPGWIRVTLERLTSHPAYRAGGFEPTRAANLQTEFSYAQKIEELTPSDFGEALRIAVSESKSKTAVLYVHGYLNDFTDAAFRTSQIVKDLSTSDYDLVPLMFSWPSDPGLAGVYDYIGLNYHEARKRSRESGYDLAQFLKEVSSNTDIGTIHIIAHSMGAEVLGHAMMKLGVSEMGVKQGKAAMRPVFRQIVFAAPDVTPRIFLDVIEPAIRTNHVITAYGSTTDLALWLSSLKNHQARAGSVSPTDRLPECIDTIDVTAVTKGGLSHSTWAESPRVLDDLRLVLRDGLDPSSRGLTMRRLNASTIWALPAKVPMEVPHAAKRTAKAAICRPH